MHASPGSAQNSSGVTAVINVQRPMKMQRSRGLSRTQVLDGPFLRGAGASPELNPMVSGSHVDSSSPTQPPSKLLARHRVLLS